MQKKLRVVLSLALVFVGIGVTPAFAGYAPNKPAITGEVLSNSSANSPIESGTVTVTWSQSAVDPTHEAPAWYDIKAVGGGTTKYARVPKSESVTSYSGTVTGLIGGTSYSITVTAENLTGTSVSDAKTVTVITSPDKPGSLTTETAKGSITLNWAAPSNTGGSAITSYLIRNVGTGETTTVSNPALTSLTIGSRTPGSTLTYQIAARNQNGLGPYADFEATTIPSPPSTPSKPELTNGNTSITAQWTAVTATASSPVSGYKVYLRDMSKATAETPTVTTSTSVTFESLTAGASYTVRVLATNLAGDSALSETSTVKTLPAASVLADNTPVFTPSTLPDLVIGGTTTVTVTAPSGGTPTIALTTTPAGACTWNNTTGVVTAVASGTCTLTATIAQTGQYAQGVLPKTFTVTKTLQTITFAAIANQPLPGPLTLSASSTSGLTVTFTASDNCTVTGNTLSFTSTGSCTVIADQAGNTTYEVAPSVRRTFTITTASSGSSSGGSSSGGSSSGGGGIAGGGGGGVGTTWFNLFMGDPDNLTAAYAGVACATFTLKSKEGDKTFGPICATKSGSLDFEANDGDYTIRTFDKDYPASFKEYAAKITFGTFEVVGAGYRGGSVPRRIITTLKKSEFGNFTPTPTPTPTPSPTATPGVTPIATPSPSATSTIAATAAKPTGFVIGGKVTGAIRPSTIAAATAKVAVKLSANFQAVIPAVKKGEKITMTIKDAKGKSFSAPIITASKAGNVALPAVKFSLAGKYTITIKVGTKTKVVTVTASK